MGHFWLILATLLKRFNSMTILVTGSAGFIGANVALGRVAQLYFERSV
jgi:hypothetical protein